MKQSGGPVKSFPLAEAARKAYVDTTTAQRLPDFTDTALTFGHLDDRRLSGTRWLFRLMGYPWLTNFMGTMGVKSVNLGLPGAEWMVKNTLYKQFVGGTTLEAAKSSIATLAERNVDSILDYGAEGKETPAGRQAALAESERATTFAAATRAVIGSVVKLSSVFPSELLERYNDREIDFNDTSDTELQSGLRGLEIICKIGRERGCEVYLDAEESWIQHTIDQVAEYLMSHYNQDAHVIFTTCQLYRHDRLSYLKAAHLRARQNGYRFGVKAVRGAYMVKERRRAQEMGYADPIQPSAEATHRDYDAAMAYCLEHHEEIAFCVATHNQSSIQQVIEGMQTAGIRRDHPNIRFSQLLGMSGHLTFNLAEAGYNVSKYMVYGPVKEVLPYLVRRAQENTSVTGETGRELGMLNEEIRRRRA